MSQEFRDVKFNSDRRPSHRKFPVSQQILRGQKPHSPDNSRTATNFSQLNKNGPHYQICGRLDQLRNILSKPEKVQEYVDLVAGCANIPVTNIPKSASIQGKHTSDVGINCTAGVPSCGDPV